MKWPQKLKNYFPNRNGKLSLEESLEVPGYNLFRADHPSNTKRGGV